ncbi:hypothetical protein VULLAG_LOCUS10298 [Vulpes lagopus]
MLLNENLLSSLTPTAPFSKRSKWNLQARRGGIQGRCRREVSWNFGQMNYLPESIPETECPRWKWYSSPNPGIRRHMELLAAWNRATTDLQWSMHVIGEKVSTAESH